MLEYIRDFSATEKVVFGLFVILALVTSVIMAKAAIGQFMVEVPAYGGELREGLVGLPRTVNPVLAVTDIDKDLSALIYSGLMKYEGGALTPDLAESYEISGDGLTYDFKLRPDLSFQDGEPLSVDDVLFTVQKIQDANLKSPRRADWVNVTAEKVSDGEVRFTLKQAYAPFLGNATVGILPKHIWGEVNNDQFIFSQYNIEPVGSGPYEVASIVRDQGGIPTEYKLETWRDYAGARPFIDSLVFNFFADEEKAVSAVESGKISSLSAVSQATAAKLASNSGQPYEVVSAPLPRVFGVFFNHNQSPVLADKVVRQALEMAVDRDSIINAVLNGYGASVSGPLPPEFVSIGGEGDASERTDDPMNTASTSDYLQKIADAQALLEEDDWRINSDGVFEKKTSKSNTILAFEIYTADSPDLKQTAELVKDAWTKLGARVGVKVFESGDLYQNIIKTRKYDALLFGMEVGKGRDLYAFWHSSQRNAPGLNVAMYTNSKVDKVLEEIRSTASEGDLAENYAELDRMIRDDAPAAFLYAPDFIYVVPKKLKGLTLNGVAAPTDRWNEVNKWYLNTEKVWRVFSK